MVRGSICTGAHPDVVNEWKELRSRVDVLRTAVKDMREIANATEASLDHQQARAECAEKALIEMREFAVQAERLVT